MLSDKLYPVWTPGPRRDRLIRDHLQWLEERNKRIVERRKFLLEEWTERHIRSVAKKKAKSRSYYLNTKDSDRGFTARRAKRKADLE